MQSFGVNTINVLTRFDSILIDCFYSSNCFIHFLLMKFDEKNEKRNKLLLEWQLAKVGIFFNLYPKLCTFIKVDDETMLRFVIDKTAVPYFANLVWFIGNHILEIDACVRNDADHRSLGKLKDLVAEHLDHVHYLNDILCLGIENLNEVLTGHLLNRLFIPLYIYSLVHKPKASNEATTALEDMKPHVSKVTALFLLSQVFLIIKHVPLVRLLAWIIFHGDANIFTERGASRIQEYSSTTTSSTASGTSKKKTTIGKGIF